MSSLTEELAAITQQHYEQWQQRCDATEFIDYARDLPDTKEADKLAQIACIVYAFTHDTAGAQESLEAIATAVGLV